MRRFTLIVAASTLIVACADQTATAPDVDVRLAKGGSGGGKPTTSTIITPVQLTGRSCSASSALAINDADPVTVAGECDTPRISPLIWTPAGTTVIPDTGVVRDVSFNGSAVGELDFKPFYRAPNSQPVLLPMNGRTWGSVDGISANGTVAVGSLEYPDGASTRNEFVLWTWNGIAWDLSVTSWHGRKVSADGQTIAGGTVDRASAFRYSGGAWLAQPLDDGGALSSRADGINQDGTVIVGQREVPLSDGRVGTYEQPVAWTYDGSSWTMTVLAGINIQEGAASGVATRIDGSVVAVGYAWEDKAGAGQQQWAVAWIKPAGASAFNSPVRLEPVVKGASATARDVNKRGQVVGSAATRTGPAAVMWSLP